MTADIALVENQPVVDALVDLLDLESVEPDVFVGRSPQISLQRVFGGQVAGQALVAAARTVDPDRPRALVALRTSSDPGTRPSRSGTESTGCGTDSRSRPVGSSPSSTTRRSSPSPPRSSWTRAASTTSCRCPMCPAPETLPTLQDRYEGFEDVAAVYARLPRPFDIRYVDDPPWIQRSHGPREHAPHRMWMRAAGTLPDDPVVHVCALTFASDLTVLDSVLIHHGLAAALDPVKTASLDHAMWFHRELPRRRMVPLRDDLAIRLGWPRPGGGQDLRPRRPAHRQRRPGGHAARAQRLITRRQRAAARPTQRRHAGARSGASRWPSGA